MIYTIDFDKSVVKIIAKWKKSNPVLFKKLINILVELEVHPRNGLGHPEALVGGGNVIYSRHIDKHNRILYKIIDEEVFVFVFELVGHYSDK